MIRRKELPTQTEFWVPREKIAAVKGASFYDQLARDLDEEGFGEAVRELCAAYYSEDAVGRPPVDPEVYFKMLMVGFFEKLGSERGIAARCEDSLSIRRFLRYDITEATPNHSTLSLIRQRLPIEVYQEVFALSLKPLRKAELITGENIGLDSSLFEANASLEKLVRREDGQSYRDYLKELAAAAGIDPEDTEAVIKFDRQRKDKKISNQEWYSPNDPDAKIGPRKDGAWDMIHKVENVIDLDSGSLLSIEVQPADKADSTDMADHCETAVGMVQYTDHQLSLEQGADSKEVADGQDGGSEGDDEQPEKEVKVVGDKGYHKNEELARLVEAGLIPCIVEPSGKKASKNHAKQAEAFEINKEFRSSEQGRELLRQRCEKVERSFRHLLDHGDARRTTLCGHEKIAKRMDISGFSLNRSIYAWHTHGYGTVKQTRAGNRNPNLPIALQMLHYLASEIVLRGRNTFRKAIRKLFPQIKSTGEFGLEGLIFPAFRHFAP